MLSRIKSRRGFSLIELAVVLIVIGVIAAIAIPTFSAVIDRANKANVERSAEALVREAKALAAFNVNGQLTDADVDGLAGDTTATRANGADALVKTDDVFTFTKGDWTATVTMAAAPASISNVLTDATP